MLTIDSGIIPGSDLPSKGRILLTNSLSFVSREYIELPLLFKSPDSDNSSSLGFMPDAILYKSLKLLIRDYYVPLSGWVEMEDTEIYLAWNNYKYGIYLPEFPVQFESNTVNTDYNTFCSLFHNCDPSLWHSKAPRHHKSNGEKVPLLFVKVTRLGPKNQAVIINLAISHMVVDGCSYAHFCLNWGSLCRQMLENPELQRLPKNARYEIPHPPLFGVPDFNRFRNPEHKNYKEQVKDIVEDVGDLPMFLNDLKELDEYCLDIPECVLKEIRSKAHLAGLSFHMHLFAIVVKEEIKMQVRQRPELIRNVSTLDIAINIRPRLEIPENFCSSAAIGHHIRIKVKDILEMSTIDIAREIKENTDSATTPEGICGLLDKYVSLWKSVCKKDGDAYENFGAERFRRIIGKPGFIISSILSFKLGDVDFGSGKPVCLRTPKLIANGVILVYPKCSNTFDNSIMMRISLPKWCDISNSPMLGKFVVST